MDDKIVQDIVTAIMIGSNDPNVVDLREQAIAVAKMVHGEEIECEIKEAIGRRRKEEEMVTRKKCENIKNPIYPPIKKYDYHRQKGWPVKLAELQKANVYKKKKIA